MDGDTKGHYQRGSVDSAPSFNRTQTAQQRASGVCHPLRRAPPPSARSCTRRSRPVPLVRGASRNRGTPSPRAAGPYGSGFPPR